MAAAVIAALVALWGAFLQRKTGKETAKVNRSIASETGARADVAALAARYQDAASQLGHDKAAVRLAGVYAMSRLADDWRAERQTCVDVLCAYLRLPWRKPAGDDGAAADDDAQVRRTIASVINRHVAADATVSWAEYDFDFARAELRDFVLAGCAFTGRVSFSGAQFAGECVLDDIAFQDGATFEACTVAGCLRLNDVRAGERRELTFAKTRIDSGAELEIKAGTEGPQNFGSMLVRGKLKIWPAWGSIRPAPLNLAFMALDGGCVEVMDPVSLKKGDPQDPRPRYPRKIMARDWEISAGSQIRIPQQFIDGGMVEFGALINSRVVIPPDVTMTFKVPETEPGLELRDGMPR